MSDFRRRLFDIKGTNDNIEVLIKCGSASRTCKTGLDNPSVNDFERGEVNNFAGSRIIGDCDEFECDRLPKVTLTHHGSDGWKCDYIRLVSYIKSLTKLHRKPRSRELG